MLSIAEASMYYVHVQKGNKSNGKENQAAKVGKTSASKDGTTMILIDVSTGIRIVQEVVWFCIIYGKDSTP